MKYSLLWIEILKKKVYREAIFCEDYGTMGIHAIRCRNKMTKMRSEDIGFSYAFLFTISDIVTFQIHKIMVFIFIIIFNFCDISLKNDT